MTLANPDPLRKAPDDAEVDLGERTYTWYDPDSATFDRVEASTPSDLTDDKVPIFDWRQNAG